MRRSPKSFVVEVKRARKGVAAKASGFSPAAALSDPEAVDGRQTINAQEPAAQPETRAPAPVRRILESIAPPVVPAEAALASERPQADPIVAKATPRGRKPKAAAKSGAVSESPRAAAKPRAKSEMRAKPETRVKAETRVKSEPRVTSKPRAKSKPRIASEAPLFVPEPVPFPRVVPAPALQVSHSHVSASHVSASRLPHGDRDEAAPTPRGERWKRRRLPKALW
ncbi:hypothetical protein [Rhodoblastus sp.]|uniref:hypothetical protein n=1 Tax=Rhodoblastus sp. TaxID=1962975 RepID=UPI0035B2FE44